MDGTNLQSRLEVCGVRIPYDPTVITPNIREAIIEGRFESREAEEIPNIVRAGDNVLEIGAGIGFISTLLARQEETCNVYAVEANPALLPYMHDLHALNGTGDSVERLNFVLTNDDINALTFYQRSDFWMGSLLKGPNPYYAAVDVPTANLNAFLRDKEISLILCDIEGAETTIFEGADLSGVDRIYLELHDHVTGLSGVGDVFKILREQGFEYDPRHSCKSVVLFQKVGPEDIVRPYAA